MSNGDDKHYTDVLLEDMNSKMDAVVEAVGQIQDQIKVLPRMSEDVSEIKGAVNATKAVVKDHEHRLTQLETAS